MDEWVGDGFAAPNSVVLFVNVAVKLKMLLVTEDDFLRTISMDLLMLQYPFGKCPALRMVRWLQMCQLYLVSRSTAKIVETNDESRWFTFPQTTVILSRERLVWSPVLTF